MEKGALEYHPSKEADFYVDTAGLNYDQIAQECENILTSKSSEQLDMLYKLGGSSGGTRPKILLTEAGKHSVWIIIVWGTRRLIAEIESW